MSLPLSPSSPGESEGRPSSIMALARLSTPSPTGLSSTGGIVPDSSNSFGEPGRTTSFATEFGGARGAVAAAGEAMGAADAAELEARAFAGLISWFSVVAAAGFSMDRSAAPCFTDAISAASWA